jgi:serine/threonine protein kinase
LQHPNVIQLIDAGEHGEHLYRVEEYLDGGTLASRLKRDRMPERDAVALVASLARAMHYVHYALGEPVLHRNLKPAVVMFAAAGVPKVTQFDLVHAPSFGSGRLENNGDVVGTAAYMAPEQALGALQDLGPGTDVYGLGGILYAALTGRPPNGMAGSLQRLLERLVHEPPAAPREFNPDVSRRVEKVCLKALEKDPSRRHANALELAEDLERVNAGWLG